jgi:hypothetical protein
MSDLSDEPGRYCIVTLLRAWANCAKPLSARLRGLLPETCSYDIHIAGNPLIIYALNVHHNVGMGRKSLKEHGLPLSSSTFSTRFSTGLRILPSAMQESKSEASVPAVILSDLLASRSFGCRIRGGEKKAAIAWRP